VTTATGSRICFRTVTTLLAVAAASTAASHDRYPFTGYCRSGTTLAVA
jgi:hypothetical protein